jgi:hypothetical protein
MSELVSTESAISPEITTTITTHVIERVRREGTCPQVAFASSKTIDLRRAPLLYTISHPAAALFPFAVALIPPSDIYQPVHFTLDTPPRRWYNLSLV